MTNARTPDNQSKPDTKTEADVRSVNRKPEQQRNDSSHDHMSHEKAGSHKGAGGGAKQERHH